MSNDRFPSPGEETAKDPRALAPARAVVPGYALPGEETGRDPLAADSSPRAAAGRSGEVVLEGHDLAKTYAMGDRGLTVLRGVSIQVRKGEILAIQGPSGAGKSTLLHLLGLLDEPDRGEVRYRGTELTSLPPMERARFRNEKLGFVFQFYHLFPDLDALENVFLPELVRQGTFEWGGRKAAIRERARGLLAAVGLSHREGHLPSELSGGERQRVAIARALMNDPEVLLCDEPTGNLDQKTSNEILDLLFRLNQERGQTSVIVTHDRELAKRAHRAIYVVDGALSDGAPAKPRGFQEARFPLRPTRPLLGFSLHPWLVFVLCAAFPPLVLVWLTGLHRRFHRATRRGFSGPAALLLHLVPGVGQFAPFFVNASALGAADRILRANGERGLSLWWISVLLWPFAMLAPVVTIALGRTGHISPDARPPAVIASLAALGLVAAWTQAMHDAFYERMGAKSAADAKDGA